MAIKDGWQNYFRKAVLRQKPLRPSQTGRRIPLNLSLQESLVDERRDGPYISNAIRTSQYTLLDFIPRQIIYQFSRLAHAYLLVVAILQVIPGLSTTGKFTTLIPLVIFLVLIMIKEGYYDWKRHRADLVENNRPATVLRHAAMEIQFFNDGHYGASTAGFQWVESSWEAIEVGDVLLLEKDQDVPADIVLLHASGENRYAHVDTMALDGETNLKIKVPPASLPNCSTVEDIAACRGVFTIEDPNTDLYRFDSTLTINGETTALCTDQVIYRGSTIRNTSELVGLVVNTGEECKVRLNTKQGAKSKEPATESVLNRIVICLMFYVLGLTTICSVGHIIWQGGSEYRAWYLAGAIVPFVQIWFGFLIMFNQVIPLSLYLGLEAIRLGQLALINGDLAMYYEESDTPASVNNTNNLDDLGQISYIFTDKTGTLTENIMNLRRISVAGVSWLHRMDLNATDLETSEFGRTAREKTTEYMLEYLRSKPNTPYAARVTHYLMAMALCHTCLPTRDRDGSYLYEGSSPDEVALVKAAMEMGFIATERSAQLATISVPHLDGDERCQVFRIMDVIEFSSNRKRMSIIVRCPDGKIWLVCKGADSALLPRLTNASEVMQFQEGGSGITDGRLKQSRWHRDSENEGSSRTHKLAAHDSVVSNESEPVVLGRDLPEDEFDDQAILLRSNRMRRSVLRASDHSQWRRADDFVDILDTQDEEGIIRKCFEHVDRYAADGLRTLIYADKFLSEEEYASWKEVYSKAETSLTDRQQLIEEASEKIEQSLSIIGASAVEDKLQKGVPETIRDLRRANIKICMLTGDKRQTAINIAHSADICHQSSKIFVLDVAEGDLELQLRTITDKVRFFQESEYLHDTSNHTAVVIDGHTLSICQKPHKVHLLRILRQLVLLVDSVVCCRASPSQKALLVTIVREGSLPDTPPSLFVRLRSFIVRPAKPLTLAIGDGANDVSMILTANVGVGISGREGQQAARVADFSISQFRFLSRLLLVHGRYNYHRVTLFILTTFWKEVYIYLPQALYQDKTGLTGTSLYHPPSLIFVSFLTAASMVIIGTWEQDLSPRTVMAIPELYAYGQNGEGLNIGNFLAWMGNALLAGLVSFQGPWAGYMASETVHDNGLFAQGTMTFIVCIMWINYKILILEIHHKTKIVIWSAIGSIAGLWLYEVVSSLTVGADISPYSPRMGLITGFGRDATWWMTMIWVLGTLMLMESVLRGFKQNVMIRAWLSRCWHQGEKAREGGGVREGFSDWEPRLWQEMEKDPFVERLIRRMGRD